MSEAAPPFTFEAFGAQVAARAERLHRRLREPDADLPGVLFLDVPRRGGEVSFHRVAGLSELGKRRLATRVLPAQIRTSGARRVAWLRPTCRDDVEPRQGLLFILVLERGRRAMAFAEVLRDGRRPPRLGRWRYRKLRRGGALWRGARRSS